MNRHIPNIVSFSRIPLSIILLLTLSIPEYVGKYSNDNNLIKSVNLIFYIALIVTLVCIEFSDMLDGYLARKYNLVTNLGKILDPYSDVFSRVSYFICFSSLNIIPLWATYFVFAREVSTIFLRSLLTGKSVYLQANIFGKIKAFAYSFCGIIATVILYHQWKIGPELDLYIENIKIASLVLCFIAVFSSIFSFITYLKASWGIVKQEYIDK